MADPKPPEPIPEGTTGGDRERTENKNVPRTSTGHIIRKDKGKDRESPSERRYVLRTRNKVDPFRGVTVGFFNYGAWIPFTRQDKIRNGIMDSERNLRLFSIDPPFIGYRITWRLPILGQIANALPSART